MLPKGAAAQGTSRGGGGGAGRLNGLPDRVLIRVLWHLKPWKAARTSLLSRRLSVLWASSFATALRLDIRQPCACRGGDLPPAEAFADFVKHLLLRRNPFVLLDAIRLCWSHPTRDGDADTWVAYAVRHGAKEVELSGEHHVEYPRPDYSSFVSCENPGNIRLKIVKLIHVRLDGVTLTQLSSGCKLLEELELRDCTVEGNEIQSTSLKCLNMISCKFADGFRVSSPNLVSLRCIRPFGYVPMIQNVGFLVAATIVLDDRCLRSDHHWAQKQDDKDESDHDDDYFALAGSENSDDNSSAYAAAQDSGDSKHNEFDDSDAYYDSEWSDRTVWYSDIADEQKKPYMYLIKGNNRSADGHGDECSESSIDFGGSGMLSSLSNVKTMDLLAHPGEVVLKRELQSCPDFKNLKTLSVGEWCLTPQLDALATILGRSPNLEKLSLHLDMAFNSRTGINPRGSSFSCSNLKMVEITCCNRDFMVHILAKFFGANGIPREKILVRLIANTGNVKGGAGFQEKRKAESDAENRDAKQMKPGN
ncbi:hypothetical protein EJB05_58053, partial [Eragrostis curvula]